jgi:hypothetical protein
VNASISGPTFPPRRRRRLAGLLACGLALLMTSACTHDSALAQGGNYPWHRHIVATTFWVGEVFDPTAADGSQVYSTYDNDWEASYGGCDGVLTPKCSTEPRTAGNGYMPTSMTPKENPFYLDLPYDDVNDPKAFAERSTVIPWANEPGYAGQATNKKFSYMKNRWVKLVMNDRVCYGQIEDAGPGQYHDAEYVFGDNNARPANKAFNGAGMDVSPAINGCLGFSELDGQADKLSWQFVDEADVPAGPWLTTVTTSQVNN